jgi:hypothetical protein
MSSEWSGNLTLRNCLLGRSGSRNMGNGDGPQSSDLTSLPLARNRRRVTLLVTAVSVL